MPKIRLIKLAEYHEVEFDDALEIAQNCLSEEMLTGKGRNTWVDDEGQVILDGALETPEIYPKHYYGEVVRLAPNPSYVYAFIEELKKAVPCVVPRRFQSTMLGKVISIEEIKDNSGSTFRHIKEKLF